MKSFFDDLDALDFHARIFRPLRIARLDRHQHIQAFDHLPEHGMFVIQVRRGNVGNEELRAVRAGSRVCHREYARLVVPQGRMEFVPEFVAGAAGASAGRVAALCHEIGDDAVKDNAILKSLASQENEVVDGLGGFIGKQFDDQRADICFHTSGVFFLRVNFHFGRFVPLLGH